MTSNRYAVLIGTDQFGDPGLHDLRCPVCDVNGLGEVLASREFGNFSDVWKSINEPHYEVLLKIQEVFNKAGKDDLVLLYYSGHGKQNRKGKLHLATKNTRIPSLDSTSVPIEWIKSLIADVSNTSRIVIILDCCHSGAGGDAFVQKGGLDDQYEMLSRGRGTYILTASTGREDALECPADHYSAFTKFIIEGIRTWEAADEKGNVSIESLYKYLYNRMQKEIGRTPQKWDLGVQDELIIASSGKARLPESTESTAPVTRFWSLMDEAAEHHRQGRHDEALKGYDQAVKLFPASTEPWVAKGDIFLAQQKFRMALTCYDRVLALDPGNASAWEKKGDTLFAQKREYRIMGSFDKEGRMVEKIEKYDPETGKWSRHPTGWPPEEALFCYSEAIRLDPENAMARKRKAEILNLAGNREEALRVNNDILRRKPEDTKTMEFQSNLLFGDLDQGNHTFGRESLDETLLVFEDITRRNPGIYVAWVVQGLCLHAKGKREREKERRISLCRSALSCFDRAIELDPSRPLAFQRKCDILFALGNREEALVVQFKAWVVEKGEAYAWFMKGDSLNSGDDRSEAIQCWGKALEAKPRDVDTCERLADRFRMFEKYDLALECLKQALLIEPGNREITGKIEDVTRKKEISDERAP